MYYYLEIFAVVILLDVVLVDNNFQTQFVAVVVHFQDHYIEFENPE
jgi:hypothetical protein